jgi:hypothetical protein
VGGERVVGHEALPDLGDDIGVVLVDAVKYGSS